jgi:hypothetical protein
MTRYRQLAGSCQSLSIEERSEEEEEGREKEIK